MLTHEACHPLKERLTRYQLREHVSYCLVGGRRVFLDLKKDRYFRLPIKLERAFATCVEGGEGASSESLQILVEQGILSRGSDGPDLTRATITTEARRSALELASPPTYRSIMSWPEVFATVYSTQRTLKTTSLEHALKEVVNYRTLRVAAPTPTTVPEEQLLHAATKFQRDRLYVPIPPTCLLDSIALVRYLARHRLHASIVLGVNCNPFSAHAWVQAGDLALNETVGEAIGHVPIRVL